MNMNTLQDRIRGSLINGAIGDALGIHEISEVLFQHKGKSVYRIFGEIDAIFPNDFGKVLDQFYGGGREAEMELLGPGFHSHNKIHKSDKIYTRRKKHKGGW